MKALSLKQLGGAATEGTQGAAAEGLGHARAARKGAPRFGDALGQAVAKHTQREVGGEAAGGISLEEPLRSMIVDACRRRSASVM